MQGTSSESGARPSRAADLLSIYVNNSYRLGGGTPKCIHFIGDLCNLKVSVFFLRLSRHTAESTYNLSPAIFLHFFPDQIRKSDDFTVISVYSVITYVYDLKFVQFRRFDFSSSGVLTREV